MEWLNHLSAAVLLFSLIMYLMLDGTDLGTGIALMWFREEDEKRAIVHSMLPIWDANETWLVLLAAGLFALFPSAYSLLFEALYIPLFLMLFGLILRALALEYRDKTRLKTKTLLDFVLPASSVLVAFTQGCCAGALLRGNISAGSWSWLTPWSALCGLGLIVFYLVMGCCWVGWRVESVRHKKTIPLTGYFAALSLLISAALVFFAPDLLLKAVASDLGKALFVAIAILWISLFLSLKRVRPLLHLSATLLLMVCHVFLLAAAIYPWIIPGVLNINESGSSEVTQQFVLTGVAVIVPLTLLYHSWVFWVFSGKIR